MFGERKADTEFILSFMQEWRAGLTDRAYGFGVKIKQKHRQSRVA
jgi:hypothetical protein